MNVRMELLAEIPIPMGDRVVSMCAFQGSVLVCTEHGVLFQIDDEGSVHRLTPILDPPAG